MVMAAPGAVITPLAVADTGCGPGGPPPNAASKDVSDAYGQPATLWLTNRVIGITTAQGYGQADISSASPLQRTALLIDARQDGNHQIIVDTGRNAILYTVSGCTITPVVDLHGEQFRFDIGHRMDTGDGIGCSDLGDGRHLVGLLQLLDQQSKPLLIVRRTEIDIHGNTAIVERSDNVTAASDQDPAWKTAGEISCGDLTMGHDGLQAPY
jgi:hypothetical protein